MDHSTETPHYLDHIKSLDDGKGIQKPGTFLGLFKAKQSPTYTLLLLRDGKLTHHLIQAVWGTINYRAEEQGERIPSHEALEDLRPFYGNEAELYVHEDFGVFLIINQKRGKREGKYWGDVLKCPDLLTIIFKSSIPKAHEIKAWKIEDLCKDRSEIQLKLFRLSVPPGI